VTNGARLGGEAFGDDAAVVAATEAVCASRLIFGAVIPGSGVLEGGEFEDNDLFDCETFQNFVATMDGAKIWQGAFESWPELAVDIHSTRVHCGFFPG
jgi:hypothetical protein